MAILSFIVGLASVSTNYATGNGEETFPMYQDLHTEMFTIQRSIFKVRKFSIQNEIINYANGKLVQVKYN